MLIMTKVQVEPFSDEDMYLLFWKCMSRGVFYISTGLIFGRARSKETNVLMILLMF